MGAMTGFQVAGRLLAGSAAGAGAAAGAAGTAWATGGDPNLEGGGGETGTGTGTNRWYSGNDGIRVSIMQGTTAIRTFDLANKDWSGTEREEELEL